MISPTIFQSFPVYYRANEVKTVAQWISAGENISVVGLVGCGRSNLLGYLCYRPEILQSHIEKNGKPIVLVPVDLNHLPANNSSTLYRIVLRSFYWIRERLDENIRDIISHLYLENRTSQDPFLSQSALLEILLAFQENRTTVVLVLNQFDHFCQDATPQMLNTLRGLRDSFKGTLCFIVGMSQSVAYLPQPEMLGDMYDLLDSRICWVGAMTDEDARSVILRATRTASKTPIEAEVQELFDLAGNFPVLLKAVGEWWVNHHHLPRETWADVLADAPYIEFRLERLWKGLTQEEQFVLSAVWNWQEQRHLKKRKKSNFDAELSKLHQNYTLVLADLAAKGMCYYLPYTNGKKPIWYIQGKLLSAYVRRVGPYSRGRIRIYEATEEIYQGLTMLDLSPQEDRLLRFLINSPYRRHTYTTLINEIWSEDEAGRTGIIPNHVQQLVSSLRRKLEVNSAEPRYIVNWTGTPEGGYQFYPEGRPE